jgi:hypothetical protein
MMSYSNSSNGCDNLANELRKSKGSFECLWDGNDMTEFFIPNPFALIRRDYLICSCAIMMSKRHMVILLQEPNCRAEAACREAAAGPEALPCVWPE